MKLYVFGPFFPKRKFLEILLHRSILSMTFILQQNQSFFNHFFGGTISCLCWRLGISCFCFRFVVEFVSELLQMIAFFFDWSNKSSFAIINLYLVFRSCWFNFLVSYVLLIIIKSGHSGGKSVQTLWVEGYEIQKLPHREKSQQHITRPSWHHKLTSQDDVIPMNVLIVRV